MNYGLYNYLKSLKENNFKNLVILIYIQIFFCNDYRTDFDPERQACTLVKHSHKHM